LLLLLLWAGPGCRQGAGDALPGTASESVRHGEPIEAQPKLPTLKLYVGAEELTAELARTDREIETGMMFRTNITDDEAMLFVFPNSRRRSFWMKNVDIPLSVAYIDPEGVILEIHELKPRNTNSVVSSSFNIRYVLETRHGWFERHGVGTGAVIRTDQGSLGETLFRR
jgi:hypothetical protein